MSVFPGWPPQRVTVYRFALPLSGSLRATGGNAEREGLVLKVELADGTNCLGEASPLPGFSRESLADAEAELVAVARLLATGQSPNNESPGRSSSRFDDRPASVRFAVECVTRQMAAKHDELALKGAVREVSVCALCDVETASVFDVVALENSGVSAIKVKVGGSAIHREAIVTAELISATRDLSFRLDANRRWSIGNALEYAEALTNELSRRGVSRGRVAYFEEPVSDYTELESFATESGFCVALDETLRNVADWTTAIDPSYVGALVLKPTLLGLEQTYRLANAARQFGIPGVVSSCFESGVGLQALVETAGEIGADVAAGLGTHKWLERDIVVTRRDLRDPMVSVVGWHGMESELIGSDIELIFDSRADA